ncbi:MAG: hypothetical protein HN559_18855 [Gemmatimonadetes bacterium]|nr:hypothetical protein [Gemmatimonadota bacterium]MBT7457411.1 hypothetical protein [Gemmatimonadota bacterium]MBT7596968.1 hypothetical protein [Gemmatimonadota bacterium]
MAAAQVLRARTSSSGHGFWRALVVVQLVVSVSFLATALLVSRQGAHRRDHVDIVYDDDRLLAIHAGVPSKHRQDPSGIPSRREI